MMPLSEFVAQYGDKAIDPEKLKDMLGIAPYRPVPALGSSYYIVTSSNNVATNMWDGNAIDKALLAAGNCFLTREPAEFEAERRKVKVELERLAMESGVIDWGDLATSKYRIHLDREDATLEVANNQFIQHESASYFASAQAARAAITTIGENRIKKYLFGVSE